MENRLKLNDVITEYENSMKAYNQALENCYQYIKECPYPNATMANMLGIKYQTFRYKIDNKSFTNEELLGLLNHFKGALV